MILQALNQYYDRLVEAGTLDQPGWQPVKVSYALQIDCKGQLRRVLPLLHEEERGKKKIWVPQVMNLPAQQKRSVGIVSNFLCDNATYLLGIDSKGKPERSVKCFQACKDLHENLLQDACSASAHALLSFFRNWDPETAKENETIRPYLDELMAGVNLVFDYQNTFIHEDSELREIWNENYSESADGEKLRCLVTGTYGPIARLHPSIKGVSGGQATGTSIVSFNAPAFESFGRNGDQGYNAPVSEKAAFAYTQALNYMIAQREHHMRLSDTTIVFWAESGANEYAEAFSGMMGENTALDEKTLHDALKNLAAGRKIKLESFELNPDEHFYVLGLAPNAARLSVRFFLQDSFGMFANRMLAHHERMRIVKPAFDTRETLSFRQLLSETVNQKSQDKMPSPILSGALVRSVLMNLPYPRLLMDQVEIRIRAEKEVNRGRTAIIKAYLLKQSENGNISDEQKEALTVQLNSETIYQPYLLGRLFSVLEGLQQAANPGINATIRDRYFNSACATPVVVFPQLIKLAQAHLKKLETGQAVYYNRQIGQIMEKLTLDYPAHLSLYDQGIFQLGYYHQTQIRYMKKEEK